MFLSKSRSSSKVENVYAQDVFQGYFQNDEYWNARKRFWAFGLHLIYHPRLTPSYKPQTLCANIIDTLHKSRTVNLICVWCIYISRGNK